MSGYIQAMSVCKKNHIYKTLKLKETLNKRVVYGESAQLCDAGINKIKVLAPLILRQKFPNLFNQRFLELFLGSAIF